MSELHDPLRGGVGGGAQDPDRVVDFYLYLAAAIVTLRMLIRRATPRYRWDDRPTTNA